MKTRFVSDHRTQLPIGIADDLHDEGITCSKNRVLRLMGQEGLKSSHTKRFRVVITDSNHRLPIAPNVMAQDFTATKPNEKWAGDTLKRQKALCTWQPF